MKILRSHRDVVLLLLLLLKVTMTQLLQAMECQLTEEKTDQEPVARNLPQQQQQQQYHACFNSGSKVLKNSIDVTCLVTNVNNKADHVGHQLTEPFILFFTFDSIATTCRVTNVNITLILRLTSTDRTERLRHHRHPHRP